MKPILQKIPQRQDQSFVFGEFRVRRFDGPFHYHPELELTYIGASHGHRYVGDHIGRFQKGDLVLMGPDLPHAYFNDPAFRGRARALVLQFRADCLGAEFFSRGEMTRINRLLLRSRLGLLFRGRARDQAAELMTELATTEGFRRVTLFLQILELLAGAREAETLASAIYSPAGVLRQSSRISAACELISRRFRHDITQAEAARLVRMSPASFSRFFRRATFRTFRTFVNEVRLGYAARQLTETDRTVAEICYDSGFANLSNFNRQFLRRHRTTPRAYRRRLTR